MEEEVLIQATWLIEEWADNFVFMLNKTVR